MGKAINICHPCVLAVPVLKRGSMKKRKRVVPYAPALLAVFFLTLHLIEPSLAISAPAGGAEDLHAIGKHLPLWSIIPFVGILLSIALGPLLFPRFWHHHFGKISFFWAALFAVPFLFFHGRTAVYHILHINLADYFPFIILLWGLYTVASGIVIRGSIKGTPAVNTIMLLIGTIMASWVGTTGAAMVMIRPLLRANKNRENKVHLVCFFIFLVANIGGSLTPLGDPPLFLGFLHNVPFFWVTKALLPHMLLMTVTLLTIFYALDSFYYRREHDWLKKIGRFEREPLRIDGAGNFFYLGGIVAMVLMSGNWKPGSFDLFGVHMEIQNVLRDAMIIVLGTLSFLTTPRDFRDANEFSWFPILEVAKLFAGIFITIIPCLEILKAGSEGVLKPLIEAVKSPALYYWVTGLLSSFLDNAPTYLTFYNLALGKLGITEAMVPAALAADTAAANPLFIEYLKAISVGAVFMGANTYIGNAPNFMVKSIAEEQGVNMPSFFGYFFKYSIPFLFPPFLLITLIFF